jgi:hypothetical protein
MSQLWLPLAALWPMMAGPLPVPQQELTAQLCNGGSIVIPLGDEAPDLPPDCHQKGCHARCSRSEKKLRGISHEA